MAQPFRYTVQQRGGNTPLGTSYDFWQDNPWKDRFSGISQNYGNLGGQYLGQYANMSPDQMRSRFGFQRGVGPNNPVLGQWTAQMRGNVGNELRKGANQMANAGIASGRGGMMLPGSDLRSVLGQQANQQVAGMASDNFRSAVDYENQRRGMDNQSASSMADFAKGQMSTGLGLMGLQLQGAQSADQSQANWRQNAGNAFQHDTDFYNQAVMGESQRNFQQKQQRYQENDLARNQELQELIQQLLKKGTRGGNLGPGDIDQFRARGYLDKLKGLGLMK